MFSPEFMFPNVPVQTQEEMFDFLVSVLEPKGFISSEYGTKIKEREKNYPTGIQLGRVAFAIPHAEAAYAKKDTFVVLSSKKGIPFENMEDRSPLLATLVIALVFHDKDKHIDHLQFLSSILQDEELLIALSTCPTALAMDELIRQKLGIFDPLAEG